MNLKIYIKKFLKKIVNTIGFINSDWEDKSLILLARNIMSTDSWRYSGEDFRLSSKEFRVYSQWGDDGIIQFLVYRLKIQNKQFIEFGVGNYFESNTHFLLVNNNWSGFIIDGSEKCMDIVRQSDFFWRYDLTIKAAFIDTNNINELLEHSHFSNIGLLHIDLDGNDYWILESINLERYNPDILILEYNSNFGFDRQITVPYDASFNCLEAHFSGQYFGASLPALNTLAQSKNYYFIGCNSAGNNAYFLKNDYKDTIHPVSIIDNFVYAKSRDERDSDGNLLFTSRESSINAIKGMPVFNIITNQIESF